MLSKHHLHHTLTGSKQTQSSELSQVLPTLDKAITLHELKNTLNKVPPNDENVRIILAKLLYFCHKRHYTAVVSKNNSAVGTDKIAPTSASNTLSEREATDVFFSLTKAFQMSPQNTSLRRRLYCCLKEIAPIASNVMMIISSLSQDIINSKENRSAALRALLPILLDDPTSLINVERLLKQYINDTEDPTTSTSIVLLSCSLLLESHQTSQPILKRWLPELQIASLSTKTNYQATLLQYMLRQNDGGALRKLTSDTLSNRSSSAASILTALKFCDDPVELDLSSLLNSYKNSNPMVPLEVCKIVIKRGISSLFGEVVDCLGRFIKSGDGGDLLKYSSLKLLSLLSTTQQQQHPEVTSLIKGIIKDVEHLSSSTTSSSIVVALSIIISIRVGSPSSIEKLLSALQRQMSSIGDEFKTTIISSLLSFSKAHPSKTSSILSFLGTNILREENSEEVKASAIQTIKSIISFDPSVKSAAIGHICEFIEDSEYPSLSSMCIYFLGEEGSSSIGSSGDGDGGDTASIATTKKIVRFIYNRLILEDSSVRMVCIGALSKLAMQAKGQPSLYSSITDIIRTCLLEDLDIGVRMRAKESLWLLEDCANSKDAGSGVINNGRNNDTAKRMMLFGPDCLVDDPLNPNTKIAKKYLLERRREKMASSSAAAVDASAVSDDVLLGFINSSSNNNNNNSSEFITAGANAIQTEVTEAITEEETGNILQNGRCIKNVLLTSKNAEVCVSVKCLLFQAERKVVNVFKCTNTLDERLRHVAIGTRINDPLMQSVWSRGIDVLESNSAVGNECMVCYQYGGPQSQPPLQFDCLLRFSLEEGASSFEEYPLLSFGVELGDYCRLRLVSSVTVNKNSWTTITETLNLASLSSVRDAQLAVNGLIGGGAIGRIGMDLLTIDCGEIVSLTGGDISPFSLKARFALLRGEGGVAMEMSISAPTPEIIDLLFSVIC